MKYKQRVQKEKVELSFIHKTLCEYFSIEDEYSIFKKTRKTEIVVLRQWFQFLCVFFNPRYSCSYAFIGSYALDETGNDYDHATVLHSFNKISNLIDIYKDDFEIKTDLIYLIKRGVNKEKEPQLKGNCKECIIDEKIKLS